METRRLLEAWRDFGRRYAKSSILTLYSIKVTELVEQDVLESLHSSWSPERRAYFESLSAESRRREWLGARYCEFRVLEELFKEAPALRTGSRRVLTSVSHSAGSVLGVGYADLEFNSSVAGIGVDLEQSFRALQLPVGAENRWIAREERCYSFSPLQFWVIKEASYKANPQSGGTVIPHYRVSKLLAGTPTGVQDGTITHLRQPHCQISFRLVEEGGWTIAFAISA